ncbi:aldo/keto reductase [Lagierella sp.]|uniref:aldo/keto reductase n=1 Tax=Lagierella sp. TaxID=2849657 RepID=UPI00261FE7CF|nr:aldo/keto reductase [Lagierella sp.]
MKLVNLGKTDIKVSPMCFGSLTITPFQSNLPVDRGAYLIRYAFDKGVNFIDTAQLYNNYEYLQKGFKGVPRQDYVIATKTYAWNKELAKKALEEALIGLNTDYIDIFLLHEQESELTIKGHYEALEFLIHAKEKGYIRAVGLSTHRIAGVIGANKYPEIEILHPILNKNGLGIPDGNITEMIENLKISKSLEKGIYSMKPLGGGHLISEVGEAIQFVKNLNLVDSIAIGVQSEEEIDCNVDIIINNQVPVSKLEKLSNRKRRLIIEDYCIGCGKCVERCDQNALSLKDGKANVNREKCVLCGYCATVCEDFYIKVV